MYLLISQPNYQSPFKKVTKFELGAVFGLFADWIFAISLNPVNKFGPGVQACATDLTKNLAHHFTLGKMQFSPFDNLVLTPKTFKNTKCSFKSNILNSTPTLLNTRMCPEGHIEQKIEQNLGVD